MAKDFVTPKQYQRGVGKIKNYVDTQHYYEYPTIHYDNKKYPKGYVNAVELKPDIIYKMPKYPEVELGSLGKISLCCKNDDGSLFMINNDGNTLGFSHMMNPMLYIMGKTDSFMLIRYKSYEHNYLISVSKNNGIWSISDFTSVTPYPGSKYEYTPTTDYSPATKKYVDDNRVSVPTNISEFTNDSKYINQIKVLPVEYDNDKMVNVQNLEPHSIYVAPSDIDYLDLGCMGKSNRLVTVLGTPNTEELIYTGNKTDKYISFRFGSLTYTIYFKTDTESSRIERYVYYLTPNNNQAYTPKNDYNPTTKKYVDDLVESSKVDMCTDEEIDNMLNEVLGGDYSGN